jgi:hypothetical protein
VKLAALGLFLITLVAPSSARADENLVAKREVCRQEAKTRIAPKAKIAVDEYRRIVERRNAHVSECMTRAFIVRKDPLPSPKPTRQELGQAQRTIVLVHVRKKDSRWTTGSIKQRAATKPSLKSSARKRVKYPVRRKRR